MFGSLCHCLYLTLSLNTQDILSQATNIYSHISTAFNNFATHEHTVRDHLKSIRTREEKLDELKRKRKSVASKADAADKKLSKMSGEVG